MLLGRDDGKVDGTELGRAEGMLLGTSDGNIDCTVHCTELAHYLILYSVCAVKSPLCHLHVLFENEC